MHAQNDKLNGNSSDFRIGVSRVDITPRTPVRMAGYAHRKQVSEAVIHPLWAKVLAIESTDERVVLVCTDLIGLPHEFTDHLYIRLRTECGLRRSQVLFNSTHTHNGPFVWPNLVGMCDLTEPEKAKLLEYREILADRLFSAVASALRNVEPGRLSFGTGKAHFAVNRREWGSDGVHIGINPVAPVDWDVPVLQARSDNDHLRAVIFGYACHNAALPKDSRGLSGDYAGFAQIAFEKAYPQTTAMFLMLCGGDQNPNPSGSLELAKRHGETLAAEVGRVVETASEPIHGSIKTAFEYVNLAFAVPNHARKTGHLDAVRLTLYPVQAIRLGHGLTILGLGGEVMAIYSRMIKSDYLGNFIVAAYSNDVMSYIPSRSALREGGYEVVDSMVYYGQPGPYADDVENRVRLGIHTVLECVGIARRHRGRKNPRVP